MSIAAESVLAGIIIGGAEAYWRVADVVRPEDFGDPTHAALFAIMGDMAQGPGELDVVTIGDEAERCDVCHASYVTELSSGVAGFSAIRHHAELVKAEAVSRRFKAICREGVVTGDVAETQAAITDLLQSKPAGVVPLKAAMTRMWKGVMDRYHSGDELAGLRTGFPEIDEKTGGLQPGRVYGIGARAKMGKTILAMNICANVACPPLDNEGHPKWPARHVAVWSLEMSEDELSQRMASAQAGVRSVLLQRPALMDHEPEATARLSAGIGRLNGSLMQVSDRMDVSIEDIEAQARQLHARGELDLLCIDHIGLLRLPKKDRHDLAVGHVTRRAKGIAKDLNIPVILVFQLNRGSESGAAVRPPRPSDARDSGNIEQDLDAMFLLHRPSYYDKAAKPGLRLDLALQRNGPTGLMELRDELDCCRFVSTGREWVDGKGASTGGRDDDL